MPVSGTSGGVPETLVAFSPDGLHLAIWHPLLTPSGSTSFNSGGEAPAVSVWNLRSGREAFSLSHVGTVGGVAFSPDGSFLASAGQDRIIRVWDARDGRSLGAMKGPTQWVGRVAVSPDCQLGRRFGRIADRQSLGLRRGAAGRGLRGFSFAHTARLRPDGRRLALAVEDLGPVLVDTLTGMEVAVLTELPRPSTPSPGAETPG